MKRIVAYFQKWSSILVTAFILVCSCEKPKEEIPVSSVSISQSTAEMIEGETVQLIATVLPNDATNKTVVWASSKQSVATVTDSGLVTAIAAGTTIITASSGIKIATCSVTVIVPVSSVSLNKTNLSLIKGENHNLWATVKPDNATDKTVTWTSSNTSIATVDSNGKVTAQDVGTAIIAAKAGEISSTCSVTVSVPQLEAVDLGLSVKWASFNLGASAPEEPGDYYAWGETEPKDVYSWSTYKWCKNGDYKKITKYCHESRTNDWGGTGKPDNKTVLELQDDAANVKLGGSWRMPTREEFEELLSTRYNSYYEWKVMSINGYPGWLVTKGRKSIFFPTTGTVADFVFGSYWSSSCMGIDPCRAYTLFLQNYDVYSAYESLTGRDRCDGLLIRPVTE